MSLIVKLRSLFGLCFAAFILCLPILVPTILAPTAWGQAGTSFVLQGTVQDSSGAVIAGATVTAKDVSLGVTRTEVTDSNGHYILAALPPQGVWEITVEAQGFGTQTQTGLTFLSNSQPVLNFSLKPGSVEQKVTVAGEAPVVETDKTEIDQTINTSEVNDLPLNGRNFFTLAQLAPGAVSLDQGTGGLTFNGQGERQLTILADGMTNQLREIRTLPGDLSGANGTFNLSVVDDVQVITNNFSAEFGRSPAGVINVVTKSGTNDFHGSAFIYGRPGDWDASNGLTGLNPDFDRLQWGATVGGPIIHDKMHFLASYEQENQTQNDAGITSALQSNPGQLVVQPFKSINFFGKVDMELNKNNRLDVRYNLLRSRVDNINVGGLNTTQQADLIVDNPQNITVGLTSVLTSHLVNEARFSWTYDRVDICSEDYPCSLKPDFSNVPPEAIYPGQGVLGPDDSLPQNLRENGFQWSDKLSHTVGKHNLKYGTDIEYYRRFVTFFSNFNGTYTFAPGAPFPFNPANPASFPINFTETFPTPGSQLGQGLHYNERLLGFYVQDAYNVKHNLTVNLGLRYDYETLLHNTKNFAPRVGLAWDPFNKGKTLVRASFGMFYATIESSLINRESAMGPDGDVTLNLDAGSPLFPTYPNRFSSIPNGGNFIRDSVFIPLVRGLSSADFPLSVGNKFGAELRKTPYTEQFDLGVQQQVGNDISLSVDYIHVHGVQLLRTEDLNPPPFIELSPTNTRTLAQADALRPFSVPSVVPGPLGVQFGGYRELFAQESGDQSFYDALQIVLAKRFSRHFSLQANYTYSHSLSDSDNFRTFSSMHLDPNDYLLDRGNSSQNTPHNFTLFGIYEFPLGIRFSGIFTAFSGLPYTGLVGFDAGGYGNDGSLVERPGLLGRNTFANPRTVNLDSSLSKAFKFGESQRLELRVDMFNSFNKVNVQVVDNVIGLDIANPAPGFGQPVAIANGRQFQFSVTYGF
jgi:outer membrane receptor protein involved in Fe transport